MNEDVINNPANPLLVVNNKLEISSGATEEISERQVVHVRAN